MAEKNLPDELILPRRTISREGAIVDLLRECRSFGTRGLLAHGGSLERSGALSRIMAMKPADADVVTWKYTGGEPTLDHVEDLLRIARRERVDWIAAVGGGSVIDAAKATAGLVHAPLPVEAYHDGAPMPESRVAFLAAPTTAGTGSECTIVSVLINAACGEKKSIRHPSHMARLVILDPELLAQCPKDIIACSGMDALAQAIESFVSKGATWFSDSVALKGAALVAGNLEAVHCGRTGQCAKDLLEGSYLAGLALSNARLGLVHGLAHPLGVRYRLAHGLVCAVCLPLVIAFNRQAMGGKYERMCEAAGGDLLTRVEALTRSLGIASPFAGRKIGDRERIVKETLASGSTKANPRPVTAADVEQFLDGLERGVQT